MLTDMMYICCLRYKFEQARSEEFAKGGAKPVGKLSKRSATIGWREAYKKILAENASQIAGNGTTQDHLLARSVQANFGRNVLQIAEMTLPRPWGARPQRPPGYAPEHWSRYGILISDGLHTLIPLSFRLHFSTKFEEDFAVKLQFSSLYFGEGEEFLSPLRKFVTPGVGGYKADFGLTLVIFSRREVRLVLHSIVAGSPSSILEHRRKEGDCCFWDRERLRRGPVNFAVQRTENRRHQGRGR
ncbi:hypothetical protein BSL78_11175 [Apostichopus japonicus]|uniref:Uncharacterized protein n=1 Tax=Stichopus japonicus TaxID=307972 RepID=A0A2G8KVI5_STIJA|nr:hypothetical protein BSL78_11175 [Apostichopus japonicus]